MKPFEWLFSVAYEQYDCETGPYVHVWRLTTPWGSLRLHKWVDSDDQRAHHDHPWPFYTLVLKGRYYDVTHHEATEWERKMNEGRKSVLKTELMKPGTLRYRPALHTHTVLLASPSCWTLVLTGPRVRPFGFRLPTGDWLHAEKYLKRYGKFVCSA